MMSYIFKAVVLSLLVAICSSRTHSSDVREYCQSEKFRPSCYGDDVIVMDYAYYGRMEIGRCVEASLGYLGCNTSVTLLLDRVCSGRRSCEMGIPNSDLDSLSPCYKELKTYLKAAYSCVNVVSVPSPAICETSSYIKLDSEAGYLSSLVTDDSGCGSTNTPWVIDVRPGQSVNFTLWDFNVQRNDIAGNGAIGQYLGLVPFCNQYAVITERLLNKTTRICSGVERRRHVYTSNSTSVEIALFRSGSSNDAQFLIQYEVWGCPDIMPPANAFFRRTHSGATVGCTTSSVTWSLTCESNTWIGVIGNCSTCTNCVPLPRQDENSLLLPYGLSVAIIVGVAVIIGLIILAIGLICFTRRKRQQSANAHRMAQEVTYATHAPPAYKIYQKAQIPPELCGAPGAPPRYMQHHNPVQINGSEYSHIWETPLPGEPGSCLTESPYGMHCECAYGLTEELKSKPALYTTSYTPSHGVECVHELQQQPLRQNAYNHSKQNLDRQEEDGTMCGFVLLERSGVCMREPGCTSDDKVEIRGPEDLARESPDIVTGTFPHK